VSLLMLMAIQTASLLNQPFSKCRTFHGSAPVDWLRRLARSEQPNSRPLPLLFFNLHARSCRDFVNLHQHRNTNAQPKFRHRPQPVTVARSQIPRRSNRAWTGPPPGNRQRAAYRADS
jgi:hypothetical protein